MYRTSFPKCSFCAAEFRIEGPAPFLLSCYHNLCETCVQYLGTQPSNQIIKCSLCGTDHETGNFARDSVRQRDVLDLTAIYDRTLLVCKHSKVDEEAVGWCPECYKMLCKTCHGLHDKEAPTHKVLMVPDPREVTDMSETLRIPRGNQFGPATANDSTSSTSPHTEDDMVSSATHGFVNTADVIVSDGSMVDPGEHEQTEPEDDLENVIALWKKDHRGAEVKRETVETIFDDLNLTRKLIDRLLKERSGDYEQKQKELQEECSRQQNEIAKLKKAKNPLVSVHILSKWQSLPIEEMASDIAKHLGKRKTDMRFKIITSPTELAPNSRPLLVLCVNNSRLDEDVANALKDIRGDDSVAVVVLHHKNQNVKQPKNSEKILSKLGFRSLGAIVDMMCWRTKGLYQCDINDTAAKRIAEYLARYARPGI